MIDTLIIQDLLPWVFAVATFVILWRFIKK